MSRNRPIFAPEKESEFCPRKRVLKFIEQQWKSHEKFLNDAHPDEHTLMPGFDVGICPRTKKPITFRSLDKSFIEFQRDVLDKLSDSQIDDLCVLIKILKSAMMMDCELMETIHPDGFWLTHEGTVVIFRNVGSD